jgi:hypothetical protein
MSILTDDNTPTGPSDDEAVAALMGGLVPPKGAPAASEDDGDEEDEAPAQVEERAEDGDDQDEGADDDAGDEDEDEDGAEGDDGDEGGEKPTQSPEVSDETVVKVTVDGVEQELTVGSLKRLAGQEAALTKKSQEADTVGQRAAAVLQGALEAVLEDLSTYESVDWVLEGNRMDPEEFEWHRQQFTALQQRQQKLIGSARDLEATVTARRDAQLQRDAVEAVKVLSDPKTGIEGWNDKLYGDILSFAVEAGLPADEVSTIVNPTVIRLINDARLYRQGKQATATKLNLTPRNVRNRGGNEAIQPADAKAQRALEAKVKAGRGTDDDATALLMGRWGVKRR